jgi:3',5'-cyclic AMP phosphodiesterase CpdA
MLRFRFAIISDLHVALPHTVWDHPARFHLVEISIPVLESILADLASQDLDFLLLPGDLTQHGEPENHAWLRDRLAQLPYPVYVVPGNHDIPVPAADAISIAPQAFPHYYRQFGYQDSDRLYYSCPILPGVRLFSLNSNQFAPGGQQMGYVDPEQLAWLEQELAQASEPIKLTMVHHNVIEHLPHQSRHPLGRRYMLDNARQVATVLRQGGVELVFTGHLHIQDIAEKNGLYDITTGSLVSYPHPYRIVEYDGNSRSLQVQSHRVTTAPGWDNLLAQSRDWMGDRSPGYMMQLLTQSPLYLPQAEAEALLPALRYFWAAVADGDTVFDFTGFPPKARRYFEAFGAVAKDGTPQQIDNHAVLKLA